MVDQAEFYVRHLRECPQWFRKIEPPVDGHEWAIDVMPHCAADLIESQAAEIEALRKGVEAIANGNIPRPIGKRYRNDMEPSKHDRCVHDEWMYQDCGNCIEAFATALLKGTPDNEQG